MDLTTCREWAEAPPDCPHRVFESADGSLRCQGCHLHPDACTCGETAHRLFRVLTGTPEEAR